MRTLVAGYGRSGRAVAKFLENLQQPFDVFDEGFKQPGSNVLKKLDDIKWSELDRIVLSPGIPYDHKLVSTALTHKIEVISEIEFAFLHCNGPVIAVTGSNGKSSTVTMLESIFLETGIPVQLCGNIGKPFTLAVMENPDAVFVVEISSFQLETISTFKPRVAILLNITPDHMDRHGSLEAYEQAKLRIFENQSLKDLGIFPADYQDKIPGSGRRIAIPGSGAHIKGGSLVLGQSMQVKTENPILEVPHQRSNALFAALAALELGASIQQVEDGLNRFPGLKHRMEIVGVHHKRTWVNDSKATNTDATQVALHAMKEPYILILGGKNKNADFSVLDFSRKEPEKIILYGKAADEISEALSGMKQETKHLFRDAVLSAWDISRPGDVILLSPGCASFDQFGNFELRGEAFRDIFKEVQLGIHHER